MKNLLAAIFAGIVFSITPVAAASPLEISGTATLKYESDTADNTPTESGMMYSLTLRGEQPISQNLSLFAVLGAQYAGNPVLADYNQNSYFQDTKIVVALDRFGLLYKQKNLTYTLGRQEAVIGATALLYSRSETNIGKYGFVDGLSIQGSIGSINISAIAARENNLWLANNSLYSIHTGYYLSKNFNLGVTWAKYQPQDASATQHWAADATTNWGKSRVTVEYVQSDFASDNKAYAITAGYDFDGKTALYVTNFRVEANADMGAQSDFDNSNRGFHYGIIHTFNDNLALEAVYKDQFFLPDNSKNAKLEITIKNKF